jgi:hypothetical protein
MPILAELSVIFLRRVRPPIARDQAGGNFIKISWLVPFQLTPLLTQFSFPSSRI